jgi:hypothetical protein
MPKGPLCPEDLSIPQHAGAVPLRFPSLALKTNAPGTGSLYLLLCTKKGGKLSLPPRANQLYSFRPSFAAYNLDFSGFDFFDFLTFTISAPFLISAAMSSRFKSSLTVNCR